MSSSRHKPLRTESRLHLQALECYRCLHRKNDIYIVHPNHEQLHQPRCGFHALAKDTRWLFSYQTQCLNLAACPTARTIHHTYQSTTASKKSPCNFTRHVSSICVSTTTTRLPNQRPSDTSALQTTPWAVATAITWLAVTRQYREPYDVQLCPALLCLRAD